MKKLKTIFQCAILSLLLIASSCEVVVDVPAPDFKPSLVVNSFINTDSSVTVYLTANKYVLKKANESSRYADISNAEIQLFEDNNLVAELAETEIPGIYQTAYVPKPGVEYQLIVNKEGFEQASARTMIPSTVPDITIKKVESTTNEYGSEIYLLDFSFSDPVGADFYQPVLYYLDEQFDHFFDEDTVYRISKGKQYVPIPAGIVTENFQYLEEETTDGILNDELFDGQSTIVTLNYYNPFHSNDPSTTDTAHFALQFRHLSDDYYKYRNTADLQLENGEDPFAQPVQVYNNITNGFGIFAGYQSKTVKFEVVH